MTQQAFFKPYVCFSISAWFVFLSFEVPNNSLQHPLLLDSIQGEDFNHLDELLSSPGSLSCRGVGILSLLISNSLWPYGHNVPAWLFCPWNSSDKNTEVGCHALLLRIFPTQGSNPCLLCLLHWQGWRGFLTLVSPGKSSPMHTCY